MPHTVYEPQSLGLRCYESRRLYFPPHLHDAIELLYIRKGTFTVLIDEQTYPLHTGDFAVIFPGTIHSYEQADDDAVMILVIAELRYMGDSRNTLVQYHPLNPTIAAAQVHDNIRYAMQEILAEVSALSDRAISALIQLILARAIPLLTLVKNQTTETVNLTIRLVRYVSEHFQEPLTLDLLANALSISKYHVSRIFSTKLNTNFRQYLNDIRLHHAAELILATDMNYTDIWIESGFESQRTFYRAFHTFYGMTPREYRFLTHTTCKERYI